MYDWGDYWNEIPTVNPNASNMTVNGIYYSIPAPYLNVTEAPKDRWSASNVTYDYAWIFNTGKCEPSQTYQWGFSFLLVYIFAVATFVFNVFLYALSLRTCLYSRSKVQSKKFGKYKAVLALATAIRDSLGDDAEEMSEDVLSKRLKTRASVGLKLE